MSQILTLLEVISFLFPKSMELLSTTCKPTKDRDSLTLIDKDIFSDGSALSLLHDKVTYINNKHVIQNDT